jgi:hypothetical protein
MDSIKSYHSHRRDAEVVRDILNRWKFAPENGLLPSCRIGYDRRYYAKRLHFRGMEKFLREDNSRLHHITVPQQHQDLHCGIHVMRNATMLIRALNLVDSKAASDLVNEVQTYFDEENRIEPFDGKALRALYHKQISSEILGDNE